MLLDKLFELCNYFVEDRTLLNNHISNGTIQDIEKAIADEKLMLDSFKTVKNKDKEDIELIEELKCSIIFLKRYLDLYNKGLLNAN